MTHHWDPRHPAGLTCLCGFRGATPHDLDHHSLHWRKRGEPASKHIPLSVAVEQGLVALPPPLPQPEPLPVAQPVPVRVPSATPRTSARPASPAPPAPVAPEPVELCERCGATSKMASNRKYCAGCFRVVAAYAKKKVAEPAARVVVAAPPPARQRPPKEAACYFEIAFEPLHKLLASLFLGPVPSLGEERAILRKQKAKAAYNRAYSMSLPWTVPKGECRYLCGFIGKSTGECVTHYRLMHRLPPQKCANYEEILHTLKDGPATARMLVEKTGIVERTLYYDLRQLEERGLVVVLSLRSLRDGDFGALYALKGPPKPRFEGWR